MAIAPNSFPLLFFCILAFSLFFLFLVIASAIRIVPENHRLSVFRLGRYIGDKGPGMVMLFPFIDKAVRLDVDDQVQHARAMQQMWGVIGETQTPVHADGHVEVSGQVWNAVSREPIPAGAKIRVVRVLLEVEKLP
jgi:regulator of protease activity HflC (stomatin/prohibitin superfamily)